MEFRFFFLFLKKERAQRHHLQHNNFAYMLILCWLSTFKLNILVTLLNNKKKYTETPLFNIVKFCWEKKFIVILCQQKHMI